MAGVLAAASSLFRGTAIAQNYAINTPASSSSNVSAAATLPPPFTVGPWKVQAATHKVNGKQVSVWSFEKRSVDKMGAAGKERLIEVLKHEASSLSRLRHPCILEMVEPMEETRGEITFATEPLISSLALSIPTSRRSTGGGNDSGELDEVEIQKGLLQVCRGLEFLHTSARLVHSNVSPEAVLINSKGDWKLGGLGLTMPLTQVDGTSTRWEFPEFDNRLLPYAQRKFDYMAPEYALDEQITVASDMYAIGCVLYTVHNYGRPPFSNHGSLNTLRENAARLSSGNAIQNATMGGDLLDLVKHLVTRTPAGRLTTTTLPQQPFFSSLAISTLNFLERSTFSAKPKEEKATFMKGLLKVLPRFSEGLKRRKILPSLVEEMKDPWLLPFILPNVFEISKTLSKDQFAQIVLPNIKPLFQIRDPPQNMITLLDNLKLFQEKTTPAVFKEHVMPLVYAALESEHVNVQERALKAVPDVDESVDYSEVQNVLFPKIAVLFTKTRVLSVKVDTLLCFLHLVKVLDTTSLTQKMVPLLSRIRTKEPSVMMATLDVHEAMGQKVDREAVATLVLPQLWAMSIGPLLSVDQFSRFMKVIRLLGDRVEREQSQHLREHQRIEQQTSGGTSIGQPSFGTNGELNFEDLVAGGASSKPAIAVNGATSTQHSTASWDEVDPWDSIFAEAGVASTPASTTASTFASPTSTFPSLPQTSTPLTPSSSLRPIQQTSPPSLRSTSAVSSSFSTRTAAPTAIPALPGPNRFVPPVQRTSSPLAASSWAPLQTQPISAQAQPTAGTSFQVNKPNYNISMVPDRPIFLGSPPFQTQTPSFPSWNMTSAIHAAPAAQPSFAVAPLAFSAPSLDQSSSSILMPTKVGTPAGGGGTKKTDWQDFDPLG
ncbi:kinase-like protein [Calocera viscosa TUFC12733]|uniref:Kinase-like protein n=1 Tax=Calocera viscosa (strain TUFC12733) TaxID=1330018 RepID=A0A167Q0P5_CALVF|nr:kinase-like protein [Calocera viscosa TUFC12733]